MAFRTEFFIKTGLVLLGASINLAIIAQAAGPAIAQSAILITCVFLSTWFLADSWASTRSSGRSLPRASRSAVSPQPSRRPVRSPPRKEQLAFVTSLVVLFALPSIFIQPWMATPARPLTIGGRCLDRWQHRYEPQPVAAAASIVGDDALKIATIVKTTQNALMGVVAFLLAAYFIYRVEKTPGYR
jgi:uncharacterized membrane protein YadS